MNERVLLRSLQTLAKWCSLHLVPKRHGIVHVHVTSLSLSLWFILLASCTFIIAYSIRNEGGRSGPFYHASCLSTYIFCTCNRQQRRGSLTEKLFAVSECWSSEHLWSGKFAVHCKVRYEECVRKLCSFI